MTTGRQPEIATVPGARARGARGLPPWALIVLAALGAALLVVVASLRWAEPQDEQAYWLAGQRLLAGQPLYDLQATPVTPYAYWYPPPMAQVIAPLTAVLSSWAFRWAWSGILLGCLLAIARGRLLVALALVAFLPVAVELWFRNVHLLLAVTLAFGILRWPWLFAVGAIVKVAPGLGVVYLLLRRRWRDAAVTITLGVAILLVSIALDSRSWVQFLDVIRSRGPGDVSSLIPVVYPVRVVAGLILTVAAARARPGIGEPLLIVAVVLASPTLFFDALSMLIAIIPVVMVRQAEKARAAESSVPGGVAASAGQRSW